ncbi:hypothetical protein B0H19DRAFT_1077797 [Mycena capillaripes]|nr:hypothetical protein B0H19DRAFT_1077797 [Mycena capillaripes]
MAGHHPHAGYGPRGSSRTSIAARRRDVPPVRPQGPPAAIAMRGRDIPPVQPQGLRPLLLDVAALDLQQFLGFNRSPLPPIQLQEQQLSRKSLQSARAPYNCRPFLIPSITIQVQKQHPRQPVSQRLTLKMAKTLRTPNCQQGRIFELAYTHGGTSDVCCFSWPFFTPAIKSLSERVILS